MPNPISVYHLNIYSTSCNGMMTNWLSMPSIRFGRSLNPIKDNNAVANSYNELLHIFYRLRLCNHKNAASHVDKLDAAMKANMQQAQHMQELMKELNALNQSLSRLIFSTEKGWHYLKNKH